MWCQERFKVAIQQLTDGKVISSRIHTCTHRRGEGISLISYDSTSTRVEGFTASGLSNTTGFHARTSFQLALSSCTTETLDGVAWLSLACTQGAVSICILWGIVERVGPPQKWAAWKLKQMSRLEGVCWSTPPFSTPILGNHSFTVWWTHSSCFRLLTPAGSWKSEQQKVNEPGKSAAIHGIKLPPIQKQGASHPSPAAMWGKEQAGSVWLPHSKWLNSSLDKAPAPQQPVTASDTIHVAKHRSFQNSPVCCVRVVGALSPPLMSVITLMS